jgi:hypothetical protein
MLGNTSQMLLKRDGVDFAFRVPCLFLKPPRLVHPSAKNPRPGSGTLD